ncbi:MAG: proline--tRNA ligase [Rhabdochlamydiaceae bacterium]
MQKKQRNAISPTRDENYPEWYQQVVKESDLAEHSPVRGCMVIKPWGYAIWENMQKILDHFIKSTGHQNAYFPLFIPLSFLEKEAAHIDGFAKECAVVTHHRLEVNQEGKLVPVGELEEPLIVRPTSETIIGEMFAKWITSYRDLPLLINQWANVVRWEMRTRLFLRTTEFLWQEGHTAHATKEEAEEETRKMLDIYENFALSYLAIPVIKGEKIESERFPGADNTYTIEAMMQDGKALQAGTSHFLGQKFAKSSQIKFRDKDGEERWAWTTSWGVTTRLIGALVMTHGDDDGLVLPPKIAPSHIVIIPVLHKEESKEEVLSYCHQLKLLIEERSYEGEKIRVVVDERHLTGGEKSWSWIKKGIPLRLEVGPRDIKEDRFGLARRDKAHKDLSFFSKDNLLSSLPGILQSIQQSLYDKALRFKNERIQKIESKEDFYRYFSAENTSPGFALAYWAGGKEEEEMIKKDLNVTIRCIPLDQKKEEGHCVISGLKSTQRVIFAKSY